jgi:uncharacterized lipoprotein YajG
MATSRIAVLAATTLLLAGCASMGDDRTTYVAPVPTAASQQTVQTDTAFMQKVEQQARMRGIDVQWVNPPTRRVKTVASR